jgi:hypothetical protein
VREGADLVGNGGQTARNFGRWWPRIHVIV